MRMRGHPREEAMRQVRVRRAQNQRIEAPIGGWNTRDAVDNVPPSDALLMDNWIPDLGELRTRPGYDEHCWIGDVTTGANLILTPGFEAGSPSGSNFDFDDWTETTDTWSFVLQDATYFHGGTKSGHLLATRADVSSVHQDFVTTASTTYTLAFYVLIGTGASPTEVKPRYGVYDVSNAADLIATTEVTMATDGAWQRVQVQFTTVVGGISTRLYLYSPDSQGIVLYSAYYDTVSVYESVALGAVETLVEYNSGSDRKMIACQANQVFDVSTALSPVDITNSMTITMDRWQTANFDGKIGFVNGTDNPLEYNGTTLSAMTLTGPTKANVIGINVFKNRTWFWEDGSQDVWYSALNALGGACTEFPLSRVGQFGGSLISMITWTRDGGSGPDDFAVFLMSSGEAIVYQGSSPAVGGDWAIVGIYNIGEPLSVRGHTKYGGDVLIATKLDYVSLQDILSGVEANRSRSKIVKALREAIGSTASDAWGWDAVIYPKKQLAIMNVPVTENEEYQQHVMNTITGAWCRFTGIVANTWCLFDNDIYFGSADGYVYKFDSGYDDDGTAINSALQTAWMPMGGFTNKQFISQREFYKCNADVTLVNKYAIDYEKFGTQEYPVAVTSSTAEWGDPWGSPWTSADEIFKDWEMVGLYGEVISQRKYLSTKQQFTLYGMSWLFEPGERL